MLIIHFVYSVLLVKNYKSVNICDLYIDSLLMMNIREFLNVVLIYLSFVNYLVEVKFVLAFFH